ncbi:CCD81 protein, partial [Turnix velox]|nr:CCD81 protein [Turnix velox]
QGVHLPGLGTFAMVREPVRGQKESPVARRPVFQLDIPKENLEDLVFHTEAIPGNVTVRPVRYNWVSHAASIPASKVEGCVRETILLYSLQLRTGQCFPFTFKEVGVLSCQHNILCMRFYYEFVTRLETQAPRTALLHT